MTDLRGKVAIVTGAGGMHGLGRAIASAFAREGAALALSDAPRGALPQPPPEVDAGWEGLTSVVEEARAAGADACGAEVDLKDAKAIDRFVDDVLARFGRLDILVNNHRALMGRDAVPMPELDEGVWREFFEINLHATFRLTQRAARAMIERGTAGRIVHIGSDMSRRALPRTAAYAATKFALLGFTQASALDLAEHRITVNTVCPGPIRTGRFSHRELAEAEKRGLSYEQIREEVLAGQAEAIPLGRVAEPAEVAELVAFLASERAGYITGQAVNVNGGMVMN
ncbi:MAG: SDR family oxidoreductase [Geminicoccaceae bacterium]|nr:SDR family oxidoreductase [Geminicoccaceae bacterium]